jgi:hypothetical protein
MDAQRRALTAGHSQAYNLLWQDMKTFGRQSAGTGVPRRARDHLRAKYKINMQRAEKFYEKAIKLI